MEQIECVGTGVGFSTNEFLAVRMCQSDLDRVEKFVRDNFYIRGFLRRKDFLEFIFPAGLAFPKKRFDRLASSLRGKRWEIQVSTHEMFFNHTVYRNIGPDGKWRVRVEKDECLRSLPEIRLLAETGRLAPLTIERAEELKGKYIHKYVPGYPWEDWSSAGCIGEIMREKDENGERIVLLHDTGGRTGMVVGSDGKTFSMGDGTDTWDISCRRTESLSCWRTMRKEG